MARRRNIIALAGAAAATGVGFAAQRAAINKRRRNDPESGEDLSKREGTRHKLLELDDGALISVEEVGPGNATRGAVFIHGSVLRNDTWHYQMQGLGGHRLIFAELRGHGRSTPKGLAAYEKDTLAADLLEVIEDSGLEEAVVVGHSIGGGIALEMCRMHPEILGDRLKGLVLVNTTHGPFTESILGSSVLGRLERVTRRPMDVLGKQHERIESLRKYFRPTDAMFWAVALAAFGPGASPAHIDHTYRMLSETPVDVIFDLIRTYRHFDMTSHLGEVTVPALVIGGTHDRITLPKAAHYLAAHLPKSDLHIFEDCGHMSMLERHEEFNRLVAEFLNDTLGAPKARRRSKNQHG